MLVFCLLFTFGLEYTILKHYRNQSGSPRHEDVVVNALLTEGGQYGQKQ